VKWKVEIVEVRGNARLFRDVLKTLDIQVLEEANGQRPSLAGALFESCSTLEEVRSRVLHLSEVIRLVGNCDRELAVHLGVETGRVFEQRPDGTWIEHLAVIVGEAALVCEGARVESTAVVNPPFVTTSEADRLRAEEEEQRRDEERRELAYQQLRRNAVSRVVSAFQNPRALQVQRLLAGPLNPLTMGHIFDIVQDDLAHDIRQLTTGRQATRFCRSINHPAVFGEEARHIVSSQEPPSDPMTLNEARDFVTMLATRWLERIAGLS
jgi:hypothetical protein